LISDPHNLAWLFNIRGSDVSYTPLPIGWAYLPADGRPVTFLDGRKLSPATRQSLSRQADVLEPDALLEFVEDLGRRGERVAFDAATVPAYLTQAIELAGGKANMGPDPITLMKAKKNAFELAGARSAHERDGAAMANFLSWFATEAPRGRLTEIDAVKALETFRRASLALKDLSFPTIAGAGPNSAIPHYRVSEASNRKIERGIFLVDSGAQYEDGTTDITRTIAVGRPSPIMRDRFTRVLKGHIAVARAIFPPGTNGAQIDALARGALWRAGLDFDHGTGHGIGSYLSVHEGPQRIAKTGMTALAPGMIISNEPGYYAAGAFGIRIENLLAVEMRTIAGGERPMLGFETLTFAPIDLSLVEPKLMDADEIAWLDAYHARVRKTLSPRVDSATRAWLTKATRRLAVVKARRG
jgi:Xaa-Pro aminopeptidase